MKRREFISLIGGAAAMVPLVARAQQAAMPIVGFVSAGSSDPPLAAVFRKGLNEADYFEGRNVMVEYHWLEGQFDRLQALMADLVRRRVTVIATPTGNFAALAAKAATTDIPIVFSVGEDPVKLGLVASLARPGGNLTGINFLANELAVKRLALLHELVPKAVRIAVLVNPANVPATESALRDIPDAARAIGLQVQVLNASTRGRSRRPSPLSCTIASTHCTSLAIHSSRAGACNLRRSRRPIGFPRPIPLAKLSKPAG